MTPRIARKLSLSLCLVLGVLAFCPSPARADRKEDARAAAERADHAFGKRDFASALTEYQASYEKYAKPYLLFRIAECQRNLGKDADALATYQKYLAKVSHGGDRKKAEAAAAELQTKLDAATAAAATPEPVAPPAPVAQSNDTEAPPMDDKAIAAIKARKTPLGPTETTATAPKADVLPPAYDPTLPPEPAPRDEPLPPGEKPPVYKRWWPWTVLAAGVVVGVSVGLGVGLGVKPFHSELPVGGPGTQAITQHAFSVRF